MAQRHKIPATRAQAPIRVPRNRLTPQTRCETELAQAKKGKSFSRAETTVTTNVSNFEGLLLAAFGSFALARVLAELVFGGERFGWFARFIGQTPTFILFTALLGALMGVSCWWGLTKISFWLKQKQTIGLFLGFAFAVSAPLSTARIASIYDHRRMDLDG